MQIKYRITLVFSLIVTVILLLFCGTLYLFSYQDMVKRFRVRLVNKTESTLELLESKQFNPSLFRTFNKAAGASFYDKSVSVQDYTSNKKYFYNDKSTSPVIISDNIVSNVTNGKPYYFDIGDRNAVAIEYKGKGYDYIVVAAAYDKDRVDWLNKLLWILGICILAGIIIVLGMGYIFSLSLINGLTEFTHKIKHISSEKFSLRLDTGKDRDELDKLAITINDLLDRLQASFNLQRRFIDNASHELSTPLASIASQMDVALQRERSSDEYKKGSCFQ